MRVNGIRSEKNEGEENKNVNLSGQGEWNTMGEVSDRRE